MNKSELLDMMGSIRDKYVLEAIESRERAPSKSKSHLRLHRIGLLAAVLAALLLLAGCVAVYLRLQDMSIGKDTYVQYFDENGRAIAPTEKIRDVINFAGIIGSPEQKTSAQWYEFTQSYDPDHVLMTNNPDDPDIPSNYEYTYGCYTKEMMDKLDEIASENQVRLLDAEFPIQQEQGDIALEALGKTSLLRQDADATMGPVSGFLFAPYNFKLEWSFTVPEGSHRWGDRMSVTEIYNHNGYLPYNGYWLVDLPSYQQWNYTTSQGTSLLLALNSTGQGFIICQLDSGVLSISISGYFEDANKIPERETLEAFAEVFDYNLVPSEFHISAIEIQPRLNEVDAAEAARNVYVPPTYFGYADYLLNGRAFWDKTLQYAFYDLDGNGTEDLLLGRDGVMEEWLTMENGEVKFPFLNNPGRICQNGRLEDAYSFEFSQDKRYCYYSLSEGIREGGNINGAITLQYRAGQWTKYNTLDDYYQETNGQSLTPEAADAIRAEYPYVQLDWKPVWDFPIDDAGKTIGDHCTSLEEGLSKNVRNVYTQYIQEQSQSENFIYTHYRILDINGDGVDDLLLSGGGEKFWSYRTYRYGGIRYPDFPDFYLCENGVMENQYTERPFADTGIAVEVHSFRRITEDLQVEQVAFAAYNKATGTWMSDMEGTPMSTAEAEAILAKYPRVDQGMHPISELIG